MVFNRFVPPGAVMLLSFLLIVACQPAGEDAATNTDTVSATAASADQEQVARNLATFDDLDFNVFSNQNWADFSRSHHPNIRVHWPDGHTTEGLEKHIEDLKTMFVYAPDTRIKEHPIKFGSGQWTAVTGIMEGTFTRPMPVAGGKPMPPTGKAFRLPMCTIGRWENGVMVEEYLYWDNQTYMKQMGLAQ